MTCARCPRDVERPATHMSQERLEQLEKTLGGCGGDPEFYEAIGSARFLVDEIVRCRRGLCWTCDQREKEWQRAEEKRLALAAEAMANEGGRCSA